MLQLTQKLGSGEMSVQEVPEPVLTPYNILVKTHYSIISSGTEGSTVTAARKSLIGKAKEKPEQLKQVFDALKKQGPVQTYRAVKKKLDAYSPLGYSISGQVLEVGSEITDINVGDYVACAGANYANHAEINSVPRNLVVKLNSGENLKNAAYNTLGAIALQGIRQADLKLGESCAVIGLGLLGQLTCLMLKASGVKVYGIDVNPWVVETAKKNACDEAFTRNTTGLANVIAEKTGSLGVDAVIITAGTSSLDPINFSGQIARKKGKVIVVGAVPTGFDRDAYYNKELDLRMSCSYGPGRYDLQYEELGVDYPAAYVRWTENRNMIAFQELINSGKINIDYLSTHEFKLREAKSAYDMILAREENFLGVVLKYDTEKSFERHKLEFDVAEKNSEVKVGFIGAGSYAQGNLLPNIPKDVDRIGITTRTGTTSKKIAEQYGFRFCTSEPNEVFENKDINTIFIATQHDSHADYVIESLKNGKNVFVEKPLCLTENELDEIKDLYSKNSSKHLMVGFNRRFAPLAQAVKSKLSDAPVSVLYRINAGYIPKESWIQDMKIGGGRIIGEVCHFVDFLVYITGSKPAYLFAAAMDEPNGFNDIVTINIKFENGSIGNISYYANGSSALTKEYIEVYQSGFTGIIKDFKEAEFAGKSVSKKKLLNIDKGQSNMVKQFFADLKTEGNHTIQPDEIFAVTDATFKILQSIKNKETVKF